jgi:uncharacterized protein (DUF1015 family)
MTEVKPLRALRYDPRVVGSLDAVAAPPYDVIDDRLRRELVARSPFNAVEVDLPRAEGSDPYLHAQTTLEAWRQQGIVVRDREPALWAMAQDYAVPGRPGRITRRGFFCRVRVEDYGPGRIRPHERTHPEPREDRLRLQRATRANLSPIFSIYPDDDASVWGPLAADTERDPDAEIADHEGTTSRLWRVSDDRAIAAACDAMAGRELLIADGHHRYETARAYAEEIGGEGEHRYVLMFLCALSDPGLTVLPTHRLLSGLDERRRAALAGAIRTDFEIRSADSGELVPEPEAAVSFGYVDAVDRSPRRITLADPGVAERAMPDKPEPYRRLATAVLEAVLLRGALGMSDDEIAHGRGVAYTQDAARALAAVADGAADAAFLVPPTPVESVRRVAETGEPMPPKSTYFHPKVPTGLVFNPLE